MAKSSFAAISPKANERLEASQNGPSTLAVHDAISTILKDKVSYTKSLNYAVNYCRAALILNMTGSDLKTQVLYILDNISRWRGPGNKEVRALLKEYVKHG